MSKRRSARFAAPLEEKGGGDDEGVGVEEDPALNGSPPREQRRYSTRHQSTSGEDGGDAKGGAAGAAGGGELGDDSAAGPGGTDPVVEASPNHASTSGGDHGALIPAGEDGEAPSPRGDSTVTIHSEDLSDIAAVYCMLRTFSWQLRLSPFTLKTFACGLASNKPCQLIDEVHLSLMRLILLDMLPEDRGFFGIEISFLDNTTWPEFIWRYLEFKHEQVLQKKKEEKKKDQTEAMADEGYHGGQTQVNDPLTAYKYHVVQRAAGRDSLSSFKRENLNKNQDLGLRVTLDVVDGEGREGTEEVEAMADEEDSWKLRVDLDWGKEAYEKAERIRGAFRKAPDHSGAAAGAPGSIRRAQDYHLLELRGKISILQRLCDDLLDSSVLRCEIYQREEHGMRTVLRFTTLLHTLNQKQENVGPGRKSLSKQFTPSAAALLATPKKRGRPPKWVTNKTSNSSGGSRKTTELDLDYNPKSRKSAKRHGNAVVIGEDGQESNRDHNVDACVLCGLGGNLLCCDGCPAAFHVRCAGENNKVCMQDGIWLCEECRMLEKNKGTSSDSLQKDLMHLKKVTCVPRTGAKTATWQIQDFAFQCSILDTEAPRASRSLTKKPRSRRAGGKSKKQSQAAAVLDGAQAPLSCEWKCKTLPVSHPIRQRDEAALHLTDGFGEDLEISYFRDSLDGYLNKYRNSWNTLFAEMTLRTKSRLSEKNLFSICKYVWPMRIGRGQKSLQKLALCNLHPHAQMMIVYLSRTERLLWGLLEENWSNYPMWRSKWINSVFHAKSPHELGIRLLELEEALSERARDPSWFMTNDPRQLSNRMREAISRGDTTDIRNVQKPIELRLEDLKVGEYIDRPNYWQAVHPVRPGKKKPWPYQLFPTEDPLFSWRKNPNYLGKTKSLPLKQAKKIARQGGVDNVPGCLYPNKRYGVLSKQQEWRIRAEEVETFAELAVVVREFDTSLKWTEINDVAEDQRSLRVLSARRQTVTAEEQDPPQPYEVNQYYCIRLPEVPPGQAYPMIDPSKLEGTWVNEEDLPLKLYKDFVEIHRLESSKSDRYFLRREHMHPGLSGMRVEMYWPEEGRWYGANLIILPKERGVKLQYPSGEQEILDRVGFDQALMNQEISVDQSLLRDRLAKAKQVEIEIRMERERRIREEKEAKEQRRLERERERQAHKTVLTADDHKRLKLVNKAILDACVRISTGRDTTKGKKSKEWVASFIPRNVLNILLDRAERGELKPFCMEHHSAKKTAPADLAQQVPIVGIVPDQGKDKNGKSLNADHVDPKAAARPLDPKSDMTRDNQDACLDIVERMLDLKDSSAAEDTVDAEMLAGPFLHLPSRKILPDYYKIITAPIDIGSIRQALNRTKTNNYLRVQDFIQDVELMFANAKLYNADGSKLFVAANTLRDWFWEEISDTFPHITLTNYKGATTLALAKKGKSSGTGRPVGRPRKLGNITSSCLKVRLDLSGKASKDKDKGGQGSEAAAQAQEPKPPKEKSLRDRLMAALSVVKDVMKLPESYPFHDPVDVSVFPAYAEVVKRPMDLGTIRRQLEAGKDIGWENVRYAHEDEVFRDVKLVWTNCRLFNRKEDPVYKQSATIEPAFDTLWRLRMLSLKKNDNRKYYVTFNKPEIVLNSPEAIIGYRVGIWWPRSYCFFYGDIVSYQNGKHKLSYDDGQSATVNLLKHQIHWYDDKFGFAYAFAAADNKPIDLSALEGEDITMVRETKMVKVYGKDLPPNKPPKREAAIGWRVGLLWHEDQTYYYGKINAYDDRTKKHGVIYDDGSVERLSLAKAKVEWVDKSVPAPPPEEAVARGKSKKWPGDASGEPAKKKIKPFDPNKLPRGLEAVGYRVGVWWEADDCYYYGELKEWDKDKRRHRVVYEADGVEDWIKLADEKMEWKERVADPQSPPSKQPPKPKEEPAKPADPTGKGAIGWRVGLLWEEDQTYYYGVVSAYDDEAKTHTVIYDDATMESLDFAETEVKWEAPPASAEPESSGAKKSKSKKRAAAGDSAPPGASPKKKKQATSRVKKIKVTFADTTPTAGEAVGWRVGIYWADDDRFYYGVIKSYTKKDRKHRIQYDDGTEEVVSLDKEKVEWQKKEEEDPEKAQPKKKKAIGWRVGLLWPEDQTYYYGVVNSYDPATKLHLVLYDDATCESLDLSKTKVQWLEQLPLDSLPKLAPASGLAPAQAPQASKRKAKAKKKPSSSERGKIGQRVGIFWPDDACFYYGKIIGRNKDGTHHLEYDDGMRESLNLSKEKVDWEAKA